MTYKDPAYGSDRILDIRGSNADNHEDYRHCSVHACVAEVPTVCGSEYTH